jgi:ABC-2 type transport system permease protein
MLVNKPIGYITYKSSMHFGYNILNGVVTLAGLLLILNFFVGAPAFTPTPIWMVEVAILTVFGLALAYLQYIIVGLTAFWLNNATPAYWILDKAILILVGSYMPVALFPTFMQYIAKFSPFGASMFSTYIFYPNFAQEAPTLIAIQIGWLLVTFLLVKFIYAAAEKKLTINGG